MVSFVWWRYGTYRADSKRNAVYRPKTYNYYQPVMRTLGSVITSAILAASILDSSLKKIANIGRIAICI